MSHDTTLVRTVETTVETEAQDGELGLLHVGMAPVQVGLLRQAVVQVPLLGGVVPGPRLASERRHPVVGAGSIGAPTSVPPHVPVALGRAATRAGFDEPRVLVARLVRHPVRPHLYAA